MSSNPYNAGAGAGGKLRRQPTRNSAISSSPYARPASAARLPRPAVPDLRGNRWISKLVDPASRLISGGASWFLSSVLPNRLIAPPPPPLMEAEILGESLPSNQEPREVVSIPLPVAHGDRDTSGSRPASTSCTSEKDISEFEQLVKNKTFTRSEFEHLTEILRSRIIDLDSKPGISIEKIDDANTSTPVAGEEGPRSVVAMQNHVGNLSIPEDEVASPAELAKAYMSSKAKASFPVSQQDQGFHALTCTPKQFGRSVIPRSANLYGTTNRPKSDYLTPRPPGRSAIYRMSRSPYFKSYNNADAKGSESLKNEPYIHQSPESSKLSGASLVLKRRSSALDYEVGSFGPVRRIRQKYTPSSKAVNPVRDSNEKHATLSNNSVCENLLQASETEKRIFQHLNEITTPPKDKSSKLVQDIVKGNGPASSVAFGEMTNENSEKGAYSSINFMPGKSDATVVNSDSNAGSTKRKPSLRLSAPESSFGANFGSSLLKPALDPVNDLTDKGELKISQDKAEFPKTTVIDGRSKTSSVSMPSSSKAAVSEMDAPFSFPVTPASSSYLQPPPTPTMPRPVAVKLVTPNLQNVEPAISAGTKDAHTSTSSLLIHAGAANKSVALENGTREQKPFSTVEGGQEKTEGFVFKSSEGSTSTAPSFSFGASPKPNLSNGSPVLLSTLSATTSSVSTTSAIATDSQLSSPHNINSFSSGTPVSGRSIYGSFLPSSSLGNHSTSIGAATLFSNVNSSASANKMVAASLVGVAGRVADTQPSEPTTAVHSFGQSSSSQLSSSFSGIDKSSSTFGTTQMTSGSMISNPSSASFGFLSANFGSSSFNTISSFASAAIASTSTSTFEPSKSSVFGSGIDSSIPSNPFSFSRASSSSSSSPFVFGSSSPSSPFSLNSGSSTVFGTPSFGQPVAGSPVTGLGQTSGSPGNDKMNADGTMSAEASHGGAGMVPETGVPGNSPAIPAFGSASFQLGGVPFQFSSQTSPNPLQNAGGLGFTPGGSFSIGTGGGDKSPRRIIKPKRRK